MSQVIGQNFKTRIPQFSDDASIEEALRVYHYGVDNYTVQPIPDDSIEGHFRTLDTRLDSVEATLSGGLTDFIRFVSQSSTPNIITPQTTSTIPITIRAIASQTSSLQQWENSSSSAVARVSSGGYITTLSYIGIGTLSETTTVATNVNIINNSHKGIVVKGASSQSGNLQEWQNSGGTALGVVFSDGSISTSGYVSSGTATQSTTTAADIRIKNASHKGLIVRGFASQTANLQEWQNSGGTVLSVINSAGSFASAGYASLGLSTVPTTTVLSANILNASHNGIIVKAFSGQTANLQEWQDSSGTVLASVDKFGNIYSRTGQTQTINPLLLMGS